MCVYSMIAGYGRDRIPPNDWNPDKWYDFSKLLKEAEKVDKRLNQPDCPSPDKDKWVKEMEERMKNMEEELNKLRNETSKSFMIGGVEYKLDKHGNAFPVNLPSDKDIYNENCAEDSTWD